MERGTASRFQNCRDWIRCNDYIPTCSPGLVDSRRNVLRDPPFPDPYPALSRPRDRSRVAHPDRPGRFDGINWLVCPLLPNDQPEVGHQLKIQRDKLFALDKTHNDEMHGTGSTGNLQGGTVQALLSLGGLGQARIIAWTSVASGIAKNTPQIPQRPPNISTATIIATG